MHNVNILEQILEKRSEDVKELSVDSFTFQPLIVDRPKLYDQLRERKHLQIIAEVKRASPSKGLIAGDVDPIKQAKAYEQAGASCISVLTEPHYFKGSYNDLHAVASNVSIPVLCKDFIISTSQVDVAKAAGASVILLIVAALPQKELQNLFAYAHSLNLEVLMEVHTTHELEIAQKIGAKIIGVNNRNLETFVVDLTTTEDIAAHIISEDIVLISESGIHSPADAERVASYANAILVGESLMRSNDVQGLLQSFQVPLQVGEVK